MIEDGSQYCTFVAQLRKEREASKASHKAEGRKRKRLTAAERQQVFEKTEGRCHVCGGPIEGEWEADHVLSHSKGGRHSVDNYLPAHTTCNNYRWDYLSSEFQEILKLGIWLRTQVEKRTVIGLRAAEEFVQYEKKRVARRRNNERA